MPVVVITNLWYICTCWHGQDEMVPSRLLSRRVSCNAIKQSWKRSKGHYIARIGN
jgi:hypothetical protein